MSEMHRHERIHLLASTLEQTNAALLQVRANTWPPTQAVAQRSQQFLELIISSAGIVINDLVTEVGGVAIPLHDPEGNIRGSFPLQQWLGPDIRSDDLTQHTWLLSTKDIGAKMTFTGDVIELASELRQYHPLS